MFGRRTRTLIPMTSELLKPKIVENIQGKLLKRKQIQAKHYNISAKELPPLSTGEIVRVKPTDRSGNGSKLVSSSKWMWDHMKWGLRMERFSGEIADTSETARNQHTLGATPSPSRLQTRPTYLKVTPAPSLLSVLQKPVPLWKCHHPRNLMQQPVPRNLRVVLNQWTCLNSVQPRNHQLIIQLPAVVVPQDHLVTLRTLLWLSDCLLFVKKSRTLDTTQVTLFYCCYKLRTVDTC